MAVSRREFLQRSGLLAVGAVLPMSALAGTIPHTKGTGAAGTGSGQQSPDILWSQASFLACVGTEFAVQQSPDQKVWLLLTGVTDSDVTLVIDPATMAVPPPVPSSPAPRLDNFVLNFRASLAQPLTQGTYPMDHSTLGQFSLFIVPGAPGGQMYYAVVNRFTSGTPGKIQPGRIGPPVSINDQPPVSSGGASSGPGNNSGSGNSGSGNSGSGNSGPGGTSVPRPNRTPGPDTEQNPLRQPNLSRE